MTKRVFFLSVLALALLASCSVGPISFIDKPTVASLDLVYNGKDQVIGIKDSDLYSVSGTTKAKDAGTYYAHVSLTDPENVRWSDGSVAPLTIQWTIEKKPVEVKVTTEVPYIGDDQLAPIPSSKDYVLSGDTEGKAIGAYETRVDLVDDKNTCWTDGTTGTRYIPWRIIVNDLSSVEFQTSFEFDGNSHNVTAALPHGVKMTLDHEGLTHAGKATVHATLSTEDKGYRLPWEEKSFELEVQKKVIEIKTYSDLKSRLRQSQNFVNLSGKSISYRLMADIDGEGDEWTPVGSTLNPFMAELDGNGHKISNLVITDDSVNPPAAYAFWQNYAFFGAIADGACIKNLTLENISVEGSQVIYSGDAEFQVTGYCYAILYGSVKLSNIRNNRAATRYDLFYKDVANSTTNIENVTLKDCSITIGNSEILTNQKAIIGGLAAYDSYGSENCTRDNIRIENLQIHVDTNESKRVQMGALVGLVNGTPAWYDNTYARYRNIQIEGGEMEVRYSGATLPLYLGGYFGTIGVRSDAGYPDAVVLVDLENSSSTVSMSAVNGEGNNVATGSKTIGAITNYVGSSRSTQLNLINSTYTGRVE